MDRAPVSGWALYRRRLQIIVGERRGELVAMIGFSLAICALELASIGLVLPFLNVLTDANRMRRGLPPALHSLDDGQLLLLVAALFFTAFVAKSMASFLMSRRINRFCYELQAGLRSRLMSAYQQRAWEWHLGRNSAGLLSRIVEDVDAVIDFHVRPLLQLVSEILLIFLIACLVFVLAPFSALLLGALFVLAGVAYEKLVRRRVHRAGEQWVEANTALIQNIKEGVGGFREARVLQREPFFLARVEESAKRIASAMITHQSYSLVPRFLLESSFAAFVLLITLLSVLTDSMAALLPALVLSTAAGLRLLPSVKGVIEAMSALRFGLPAIQVVLEDLIVPPPATSGTATPERAADPTRLWERFDMVDVAYRYPDMGHNALDGVNMSLRRGEAVAVIGASGAGKSTLVALLLGILDPQEGRIELDGKLLSEVRRVWMNRLAYIPQEGFLRDASIRENVALGIPADQVDDPRVWAALRRARIAEFIEAQPGGLDVRVGEGGIRMSGGQRQRVALARAFYHGRDVLVLGEATSAIDQETEREIIDEIRRWKGDLTMVVIAHRRSTIEHCDRVYRLDGGRLAGAVE